MSEVKWVDAPKWATAYGKHEQFPDTYYWLSDEGYMPTHDSSCLPYAQTYNHCKDQFTIIEHRKVKLPDNIFRGIRIGSEWNGEGLPPVGTTCELYNCGQCHVGVIVYISDVYTIMKIDGQGEQHFHSSGLQFRPFNPLQKLIDEADRICGEYSDTVTCEKLIEAGYRKHASLNRDFSTGDIYKKEKQEGWTAGIHIPGHMNAIEVYAGTQQGAELLRDEILERIC